MSHSMAQWQDFESADAAVSPNGQKRMKKRLIRLLPNSEANAEVLLPTGANLSKNSAASDSPPLLSSRNSPDICDEPEESIKSSQ